MINTISFSSILYLKIEENIELDILKTFNLEIFNNLTRIEKLIDNDHIKQIIGLNEVDSIQILGHVLYNKFDYDISEDDFDERRCLINFLVVNQFFFQALWLVKDNSIHSELAHLIFGDEKGHKIHSNFWNSFYSKSSGKREETIFSKDELELAISYFQKLLVTNFNSDVNPLSPGAKSTKLSRAIYFLQSARNSSDLGTKISIYYSVLESIFSISTAELRHRLSETIALFLENDTEKRIELYKTVQTGYDIRSSIVHGDGIQSRYLKNNGEILLDISIKVDDIIRKCIRKILDDKQLYDLFTIKEKADISEYIQTLIFK